jgi:hypothetical protein
MSKQRLPEILNLRVHLPRSKEEGSAAAWRFLRARVTDDYWHDQHQGIALELGLGVDESRTMVMAMRRDDARELRNWLNEYLETPH